MPGLDADHVRPSAFVREQALPAVRLVRLVAENEAAVAGPDERSRDGPASALALSGACRAEDVRAAEAVLHGPRARKDLEVLVVEREVFARHLRSPAARSRSSRSRSRRSLSSSMSSAISFARLFSMERRSSVRSSGASG